DQDEACKQVAVMMYQHLQGHRSVSLIAGPTGSGKSFISERLQQLFPGIVYLRDISNLTKDGWTGAKKLSSLFMNLRIPAAYNGKIHPLIVLDECDKFFAPAHNSDHDNVSDAVQSELLSVIHGGTVDVKVRNGDRDGWATVDTRPMSFLFAGSFEKKAKAIAAKESPASLGFGAVFREPSLYERELTLEDIMEAGCIPELCGRIQRIINLHPFDEKLFRRILDEKEKGPLAELEKEFGIRLRVSKRRKDDLAATAYSSGHGMRGMKRELRRFIDEAMWENCDTEVIEIA
ncbi:MAG: AAA family ATPase, partial [Lachnospiraceae bacterium]|nr:AAA family ATPase [Lachnospiraceae bacterium]